MSGGPEFFDPFGHGSLVGEAAHKGGKILNIDRTPFKGVKRDRNPIKSQMIQRLKSEKDKITRSVMVIETDGSISVIPFGDMDMATTIGMLTMAGFVLGHEEDEDVEH